MGKIQATQFRRQATWSLNEHNLLLEDAKKNALSRFFKVMKKYEITDELRVDVKNTKILFNAAKEAGVERVVHVSISNPSEESDLEYFRDKAELEKALKETGLSYSILRPTVLFVRRII